jgi:hypothetical protein
LIKQANELYALLLQKASAIYFRLFKESKIKIHTSPKAITDIGYQAIQKLHCESELPQQKTTKQKRIRVKIKNLLVKE